MLPSDCLPSARRKSVPFFSKPRGAWGQSSIPPPSTRPSRRNRPKPKPLKLKDFHPAHTDVKSAVTCPFARLPRGLIWLSGNAEPPRQAASRSQKKTKPTTQHKTKQPTRRKTRNKAKQKRKRTAYE